MGRFESEQCWPADNQSCPSFVAKIISMTIIKFLSLTFIAVVNNMGPPLTIFLAYIILKERIARFETIMVAVTVAGVTLYSIASRGSEESAAKDVSQGLMIVMYIGLFSLPVLSAVGTISMRKMKKFHEAVVSFYLNLSIFFIALVVILGTGADFTFLINLDWISWLLLIGVGVVGVVGSTIRFICLKLQKASALQVLAPLTTLWQVLFDLTIFEETYNFLEWVGLSILFSVYVISGAKFAIFDSPRRKKRD